MHNLTIPIQNEKPGLGASYTIRPGNGVGLFYTHGPTREIMPPTLYHYVVGTEANGHYRHGLQSTEHSYSINKIMQ